MPLIRNFALSCAVLLAGATVGWSQGAVTVVHGIPGVTVDVYVNGELTLEDFAPGTVTDEIELAAGDYGLALTAPDAALEDAILTGSATVTDGLNASIVAHLDGDGAPTLSVFANDTSDVSDYKGRLVVRHLAAAPAVDVSLYWRRWRLAKVRDVTNGDEFSKDLYSTTYRVSLQAAGTRTTVFGPAEVPISRRTGTIVYAIGSLEDETFGVLVQNYDIPKPVPATGLVSVVHGVPGLTVDVYLNGALALEDFAPKTVTDPIALPAGDYDIAITAADADIADAVITASATVAGGANVSAVAHLAEDGSPTLSLFANDLSRLPWYRGRVVARHTAAAPAVDITLQGRRSRIIEVSDLSNGNEAAAELLIGRYATSVFPAGGDEAVAGPVTLLALPRRATIVYAIGSLADGSFDFLVQTLPLARR